jgi:hypothetical protein
MSVELHMSLQVSLHQHNGNSWNVQDGVMKSAVAARVFSGLSWCWIDLPLQGEKGHAFYIVESGQLSAFKDNQPLPVMSYGPGEHHQAAGCSALQGAHLDVQTDLAAAKA